MSKKWVLSIEYSSEKSRLIKEEWSKYNYYVLVVSTVNDAIKELAVKDDYILIVVCINGNDFLDSLKVLRSSTISPILVMRKKYDASEKIDSLKFGADEYIEIPKTIEECVASCKALIRRFTEYCNKSEWCKTKFSYSDIFICVEYRKVYVRGQSVELTKKEFDLLCMLCSNRKRVFTYEQLYQNIWDVEYVGNANEILWNHIKRMKQKLKIDDSVPDYIKNVRDIGYKFDPE